MSLCFIINSFAPLFIAYHALLVTIGPCINLTIPFMKPIFSHSNGMRFKSDLAECARYKKSKQRENNLLLFKTAKSHHCFVLIQETYSKPDDEKVWSAEWGGKLFFCYGIVHSKGVCSLLNPNSTFNFDVSQTDHQSRILISKLKSCEEILFIVNI